MLKIAYIGNKGHHSSGINVAIRGDKRFITCSVAGGTPDEDMTGFYEYLKKDDPNVRKYENYQEMLETEEPHMVVVSPRFDLTAKICMDCARRGIHIFAEKPVALQLEELQQLREVVRKSGISFTAMHFLRFQSGFYQAIQAVCQGQIGEVRLVHAQKSYKLGQREDFFKKKETYGGTIPWVGIHGLDWIYSVTGPKFLRVSAGQSTRGNQLHGDLESSCLCQFFLENGVMASLSVDYLRPENAPTHGDDRLRVVGTTGIVEVVDSKLTLINADGVQITEPDLNKNFVLEFLEEVLGGSPCELSSEEIFDITRIALIAREAAISGKTLSIPSDGDNMKREKR